MENFVKNLSTSQLAPKIKDGIASIVASGVLSLNLLILKESILKINQTYSKKPQIIKFNDSLKNSYREYIGVLQIINETLVKLKNVGCCGKGR